VPTVNVMQASVERVKRFDGEMKMRLNRRHHLQKQPTACLNIQLPKHGLGLDLDAIGVCVSK
jgi:hypothetical protein